MVAASGEARWHWRQIRLCAHLQDQVHADHDVEQEVAMEEPGSCKEKDIGLLFLFLFHPSLPSQITHQDYRHGTATPRIRCWAQQWYPWTGADCTDGATDHGDRDPKRASS